MCAGLHHTASADGAGPDVRRCAPHPAIPGGHCQEAIADTGIANLVSLAVWLLLLLAGWLVSWLTCLWTVFEIMFSFLSVSLSLFNRSGYPEI